MSERETKKYAGLARALLSAVDGDAALLSDFSSSPTTVHCVRTVIVLGR